MEYSLKHSELQRIIFISIPDDKPIEGFDLDPGRMLPVEVPGPIEQWSLQELSWEMIVSAMMKIVAYEPDFPDVDYYKKLILSIPDILINLNQSAIAKAREQDFHLAEELFLILRELDPEEQRNWQNLAHLYEERALAHEKLQNTEQADTYRKKALAIYNKLLEEFPGPENFYKAGNFFFALQNYERAADLYQKYLAEGDNEKIKKELREIIDLYDQQKKIEELFYEAYDFIRLGKENLGLQKAEELLALNKENWSAWFLKGWALRRLNQFQEAEAALQKSFSLEQEHIEPLNELAIVLLELEKYKECRNVLEKAQKLDPKDPRVINNLGILAFYENKLEEAISFFQQSLKLDENNPVALKYLQRIEQDADSADF